MTQDRLIYALIMLLSLGTCALLLRLTQARLPLTFGEKFGLGVGAFVGAMLGSKLPFALAADTDWLSPGTWLADGKTIVFGLVGGYLGVEVAKLALGIRVRTGDTFAMPVAFAIAIGRLGCFWIGCCHGVPTNLPWGVVFPAAGDSLPRHPTQLYEAAFHFAAGFALLALAHYGLLRGQRFKAYLLAYLLYRIATEALRPEISLWLGLTGYQWAALALIPVVVALWVRDAMSPEEQTSEEEQPHGAPAAARDPSS